MTMDPACPRRANSPKPTCWSRARRSSPSGRTCTRAAPREIDATRPHRHAGLHRYAPPPVRDGAAQLPRRRGADQRRVGLGERQHDLLRIHSADVRARCTVRRTCTSTSCSAGLSQLDAGVTTVHDVSQIHHSPAALGRRHPGAVRYRAPRRLRLFRERGCQHSRHQSRQPISDRCAPHQEAVVLVERPARPHDHGRRGLSWRSDRPTSPGRSGASSASRLRRTSSRRSASARSSTSSLPRPTGGNGHIGIGPDNLFIHMTGMSDTAWQKVKDVGAQVSIAVPDRDEHAARHAADPQDAEAWAWSRR